jgi:hypothetical protein
MAENKPSTEEREGDCASVDRELEQLVHLISTRFNGDTAAFFDSISPKPRVSNESVSEYELVRTVARRSPKALADGSE